MCPASVIGPVGVRIPRFKTTPACALERARAVVRTKEKQRVLPLALRLELGDDTTDLGVHHFHHRRKYLHAISLPLTLIRTQAFPCGDVGRPRAELEFFWNDPELELFGVTRTAQGIPAGVVGTVPFFYIFLRGVQWIMRRVERHVEQERILLRCHLIEKLKREIAHRMRSVKSPAVQFRRHLVGFAVKSKRIVAREKIARTGQMPPIALETKICRLLA